jgi:hypothetical protein
MLKLRFFGGFRMHPSPKILLIAAILLVASVSIAQEAAPPADAALMARLWRLQWLNAGGESAFPRPVAKVIDWLKRFEPQNAKRFENTEFPDVCPSGGLRLVQPSISENLRP